MKMMPYGVAAALLLGGSLMVPPAKAWKSDSQSSSAQPAENQTLGQNSGAPSIRDVQQELQQQGFYNGAIDGVWGTESRKAMLDYQQQHGLTQSGQLDRDTLQAMRGGSVTQSGSSGDNSSRDIGVGSSPSRDLGNSSKGSSLNDDAGSSEMER